MASDDLMRPVIDELLYMYIHVAIEQQFHVHVPMAISDWMTFDLARDGPIPFQC